MDSYLMPLVIGGSAFVFGFFQRLRQFRRDQEQLARHVQAERILALLSQRQPGVWDHEDLKARIGQTAIELISAPTPEALAPLRAWVVPALLEQAWLKNAERREVNAQLEGTVSIMQLHEGGPGPDEVVARLTLRHETTWRRDGRVMKKQRLRPTKFYHHWRHIDGQGWQLEAITRSIDPAAAPPYSLSCRILPPNHAAEVETSGA